MTISRVGVSRSGLFAVMVLSVAAGCAAPTRQHAVPADLQSRAVIPGMPAAVRTWGPAVSPEFERELLESAL